MRNTILDKNGCEWMSAAQYVRAIEEDFDIPVTSTTVSTDVRQGRIPKIQTKKRGNRTLINYQTTIVQFFNNHPSIAPANLEEVVEQFKSFLPKETKKSVGKVERKRKNNYGIGEGKDGDQTDEEMSAAEEKRLAEQIKRKRLQFEFDVLQGQYIEIEELEQAIQTIAIETRQIIESIIPRVVPRMAHETNEHKIRQILTEEFTRALKSSERVEQLTDGQFQEEVSKQQQEEISNET